MTIEGGIYLFGVVCGTFLGWYVTFVYYQWKRRKI
jgi:hypothetical protein